MKVVLALLISWHVLGESSILKAKNFKNPQRDVSIIITPEGYYPEKISIFTGEQVRFFVTSTLPQPSCFFLSGHNVFLAAEKGKISEGQLLFEEPGEYQFYCPSSSFKGSLTVLPKSESRGLASLPNIGRSPASVSAEELRRRDPRFWVPKDF